MTNFPEALSFDDLLLVPAYSEVKHRADIDLRSDLSFLTGTASLKLPIISSPMDTITENRMAYAMNFAGGMGIIHRYNTIEEQAKIVSRCPWPRAAAIGITGDYLERARALLDAGVNLLCLDVAHGHHILMREAIKNVRQLVKGRSPITQAMFHLMAGNVATPNGFIDLARWGADSVRVGVGSGSICSTRIQTGHGVPVLQNLFDCAEARKRYGLKAAIICDGGIRNSGDIVRALAAGADFVMCGSLFSGTKETPGKRKFSFRKWKWYKEYRGMSCYSQDTETLTLNGWKLFTEVNKNDFLATLNQETNEIEYYQPNETFKYNYEGKMIHCKGTFIDLLVTPNHELYVAKRSRVSDGYKRKFRLIEAEKCLDSGWVFKRNGNWIGELVENFYLPGINAHYKQKRDPIDVPILDWLTFLGLWLAGGSIYKSIQKKKYEVLVADFSNKDLDLIKKVQLVLEKMGVNYCLNSKSSDRDAKEIRIYDLRICNYLKRFGKAFEKFIPLDIKKLPPNCLKHLIHHIWLGDGAKSKNVIYTSSLRLRDDLMEIILKAGYCPQMYLSTKKGSDGEIKGKKFKRNHDVWAVSFNNYSNEPHLNKDSLFEAQYKGEVCCVEIPNHVVMTRRNGRVAWCGNSRAAQMDWKGKSNTPEGISTYVPARGSVKEILEDLEGGIRSGLSYAGAKNIAELRENVKWVRQTAAGQLESSTHILSKHAS